MPQHNLPLSFFFYLILCRNNLSISNIACFVDVVVAYFPMAPVRVHRLAGPPHFEIWRNTIFLCSFFLYLVLCRKKLSMKISILFCFMYEVVVYFPMKPVAVVRVQILRLELLNLNIGAVESSLGHFSKNMLCIT